MSTSVGFIYWSCGGLRCMRSAINNQQRWRKNVSQSSEKYKPNAGICSVVSSLRSPFSAGFPVRPPLLCARQHQIRDCVVGNLLNSSSQRKSCSHFLGDKRFSEGFQVCTHSRCNMIVAKVARLLLLGSTSLKDGSLNTK